MLIREVGSSVLSRVSNLATRAPSIYSSTKHIWPKLNTSHQLKLKPASLSLERTTSSLKISFRQLCSHLKSNQTYQFTPYEDLLQRLKETKTDPYFYNKGVLEDIARTFSNTKKTESEIYGEVKFIFLSKNHTFNFTDDALELFSISLSNVVKKCGIVSKPK
jgi:hypothetical protein